MNFRLYRNYIFARIHVNVGTVHTITNCTCDVASEFNFPGAKQGRMALLTRSYGTPGSSGGLPMSNHDASPKKIWRWFLGCSSGIWHYHPLNVLYKFKEKDKVWVRMIYKPRLACILNIVRIINWKIFFSENFLYCTVTVYATSYGSLIFLEPHKEGWRY